MSLWISLQCWVMLPGSEHLEFFLSETDRLGQAPRVGPHTFKGTVMLSYFPGEEISLEIPLCMERSPENLIVCGNCDGTQEFVLTQLPPLLGILQQDTKRRPLWHGDMELQESLLLLQQLGIRGSCGKEMDGDGIRESSGPPSPK